MMTQTRDTTAGGSRRDRSTRRGLLARIVAWLAVIIYVFGTGANVWLQGRLRLHGDPLWDDALLLVGFGVFAGVGALLVAKTPTNLIGWILTLVGLMIGVFPLGDTYAGYVMATRGHPNALAVFGAWTQSWYWYLLLALALFYLPLLFPDGHLPSRRWLPFALLVGIGTLCVATLGALTDTLTGQDVHYRIDNPIGIEGLGYPDRRR